MLLKILTENGMKMKNTTGQTHKQLAQLVDPLQQQVTETHRGFMAQKTEVLNITQAGDLSSFPSPGVRPLPDQQTLPQHWRYFIPVSGREIFFLE